jgi:CheY-like chemotaxis protein
MNRNLTILVIEDSEDDVFLFQKALAGEHIKNPVQVVKDGVEAIDYLEGKGEFHDRVRFPFPSVIFCDLKMPRMNGFDVLEWLRKHPECSVIPLIILSSSKEDVDVKKAYLMGANAYLLKPHTLSEFREMLRDTYKFWTWCEKPRVPVKA